MSLEQRRQFIRTLPSTVAYITILFPIDQRRAEIIIHFSLERLLHIISNRLADRLHAKEHPKPELRVVLEQRIAPSRPMPLDVHRVRHRRRRRSPDRRTARRVRYHHSIAEQLSQQLCIRSLAATRTRPAELEQRLLKLTANHRRLLRRIRLRRHLLRINAVIKILLRRLLLVARTDHRQRLLRTHLRAIPATETIIRRHTDRKIIRPARYFRRDRFKTLGRRRRLLRRHKDRSDRRVRTYKRTLIATDALRLIPHRNVDRRPALLVSTAAHRERAVRQFAERRHRQTISLLTVHHVLHVGYKRGRVNLLQIAVHTRVVDIPRRRVNLVQRLETTIDRAVIHVDNVLTLLAVRLDDRILQILDRLIDRNDVRQLEKRRLHHHVEAPAQPELARNLHRVDRVNIDLVVDDVPFHRRLELVPELLVAPVRVEQERPAAF